MNKYVGKICPYCKSAFNEDDDIVVCSDCEMPHHKDCWIDNKGCTTFGCSGTIQGIDIDIDTNISSAPKYEVRDIAQMETAPEQPAFCSRCGSPLTPGNRFCGKCGAPIMAVQVKTPKNEYVQKINEVTSKVSSEFKSVMGEFEINVALDPELELYIGSKKEYYMEEFNTLKNNKQYTSWNWFAFLISPFWCMYRKLYIPGGIILGVEFVMALIGASFSGLVSIALAIVTGLFGNYYYMYFLEQKMNKGKGLAGFQKEQYIEQHGGVNVTIPSVVAVIYVLLCVILFV
ncbi:MAG: DUF2628 domain-containing protein [Lachnospiraceae bacterium]|nr:DUF2628 domain-containing protein [Lachnospiraceae bacterium]